MLRRLYLETPSGRTAVDVTLGQPEERVGYWTCTFRIDWPEGAKSGSVGGVDAVQAVYQAMQMVAVQLYSSPHHQSGRLLWDKPGRGYGFPMPRAGRGDLVGEDKAEWG